MNKRIVVILFLFCTFGSLFAQSYDEIMDNRMTVQRLYETPDSFLLFDKIENKLNLRVNDYFLVFESKDINQINHVLDKFAEWVNISIEHDNLKAIKTIPNSDFTCKVFNASKIVGTVIFNGNADVFFVGNMRGPYSELTMDIKIPDCNQHYTITLSGDTIKTFLYNVSEKGIKKQKEKALGADLFQ